MQNIKFLIPILIIGLSRSTLYSQMRFKDFTSYSLGSDFKLLTIGDFNSDKYTDVIAATEDSGRPASDNSLNIFYQNANGYLTTPTRIKYDARRSLSALTSGDVNNDGLQDVVVAVWDTIKIFTQKSNRTLSFDRAWFGGNFVDDIRVGDFNSDGLMDIVASHYPDDNLTIYYQQADNSFTTKEYIVPFGGRNKIELGDFNHDGKMDILLKVGQINMGLYVLMQRDTGIDRNYLGYRIPSTTNYFTDVKVGDLNNDGYDDILASNGFNSPNAKLFIWYQNPETLLFNNPITILTYDIPEQLAIDDFDNDGRNDIGIAHGGWIAYSIYSYDCDKVFREVLRKYLPYSSFYHAIGTGYIGLDNKKDILVGSGESLFYFLENDSPKRVVKEINRTTIESTKTETITTLDSTIRIKKDTINKKIIKTTTTSIYRTNKITDSRKTDSIVVIVDSLYVCYDTIRKNISTMTSVRISIDTIIRIVKDTFAYTAQKEIVIGDMALKIHPNPTENWLFFNTPKGINEQGLVAIYTLDGRLMYKKQLVLETENRVNLAALNDGFYILVLNINGTLFRQKVAICK